ncbi:MAG TPA: DnaJ domain-containing protein [Thermoanaerobaculia bacterium]|nr:DnaJ domain-containing protein [Thermoanaerobaculia bacterium]
MPREADYYDLLGVARDATETEIRERFRVLARGAHPDRAPREKKAEAEAHFQALTEAVNVLTKVQRRKAYDMDQSMAAGSLSSSGDVDSVFQNYMNQGIAAFQQQQWAEAAGNFNLAVHRNAKDSKALHYLGLASAKSGDMREAVRALETAISIDPKNVRIYKDAASVMKQAGMLVKAEKALQEALRWDPSATDVRRSLEEIRAQRVAKA